MRTHKIAVTADPEIPVPPLQYGGIERVVHGLVLGLVEHGWSVTLFAHPDSKVPCQLRAYSAGSWRGLDLIRNTWAVSLDLLRHQYDLVHSFGRLAYLLPVLPLPIPKIMSYQRAITPESVSRATRLARGTLQFTACSQHLTRAVQEQAEWKVVPNGVRLETFQFQRRVRPEAPLIFLGRLEEIKGPHLAIQVARQTGRKLVLAGNIPQGACTESYFREAIKPHIDGDKIRYVGPVDDTQKNRLLGESAALLMPVLWDEPFGIVMVEALACGTPVIAFRRGGANEVVQEGQNGYLCENLPDMIKAVENLDEIDRKDCRRIAEKKFSQSVVVEQYLHLYAKLLKG